MAHHDAPDVLAVLAFIAAGAALHWPPALAIGLKPTFAPLALIGARSRSWRIVLLAVVLVSLAAWSLSVQYAAVISNARLPLTYSLLNLPPPRQAEDEPRDHPDDHGGESGLRPALGTARMSRYHGRHLVP